MAPVIDDLANEELGKLLKALRTNAHRSPEWMADQLRKSVRTIHNWEAGRNRASVADVIAYETLTKTTVADLRKRVSSCNSHEQLDLFSLTPLAADLTQGGVLWELSDRSSAATSTNERNAANGATRRLVA